MLAAADLCRVIIVMYVCSSRVADVCDASPATSLPILSPYLLAHWQNDW